MFKKAFFVFAVVLFFSCKTEKKAENLTDVIDAETIKVVDYEGLEPYLSADDNKTYVVNFWATWCAPCVKELPYFQDLDAAYSDSELSLTLVSLDFPDQLSNKLIPFTKNIRYFR